MTTVGKLGEIIIAEWLIKNNHQIIAQNWRCRQGEIDIIALEKQTNTLIFVEVKTRSLNNWDENGLLAVNEQKQEKILLTAENFLSVNPEYSEYNCRFDLALLTHKPLPKKDNQQKNNSPIKLNSENSFFYKNYHFTIKTYLQNIMS